MDVSEDVVETHGLTKLVHHVLSDSYVPDDYLKGIPYYDALRKGRVFVENEENHDAVVQELDLELQGCVEGSFQPSQQFEHLVKSTIVLEGLSTEPCKLEDNVKGELLNVSRLGSPKKKNIIALSTTKPAALTATEEQPLPKPTKISLKTAGVKKIKLKIGKK